MVTSCSNPASCKKRHSTNKHSFYLIPLIHFINLCYTWTAHQFEKVSSALEAICKWSNLSEWWSWWHARHYHIVPAFQGFNLPGVNLAISGNSFIKCRKIDPWDLSSFGILAWNLVDFRFHLKSSRFHDEIWQISWKMQILKCKIFKNS